MSTVKVNVEGFEYQLTGVKTQENKDGVISGFVYALNELDKSQYFGWFRWDQRYENPIFGYKDAEGKTHKICKGQIIEYIKWKLGKGTQQQKEVKQMNKYDDTVLYGRVIKECLGYGLTVAETVERINTYLVRGNTPDYEHLMAFINQYEAILEDQLEADADYYECQQQRKAEKEALRKRLSQIEADEAIEGVPAPSDEDVPMPEDDLDNMPDHAE